MHFSATWWCYSHSSSQIPKPAATSPLGYQGRHPGHPGGVVSLRAGGQLWLPGQLLTSVLEMQEHGISELRGCVCQDFLAKCCVCKIDTVPRTSVWIFKTCPTPYKGFPGGSVGKESACGAGDPGSIPESRRSPGQGNGNPLQYSCLENPMDRGPWWVTAPGVAKSQTRLSN